MLLGQGNCMNDNNASMPDFYIDIVDETVCRSMANEDNGSVAYDYQLGCADDRFYRIQTLSDRQQTPSGFEYEDGSARSVTSTIKRVLTSCYLRIN